MHHTLQKNIAMEPGPFSFCSEYGGYLGDILLRYFVASSIEATRPTVPSTSRTLIPWGWDAEFVRMADTTPRVVFPLR